MSHCAYRLLFFHIFFFCFFLFFLLPSRVFFFFFLTFCSPHHSKCRRQVNDDDFGGIDCTGANTAILVLACIKYQALNSVRIVLRYLSGCMHILLHACRKIYKAYGHHTQPPTDTAEIQMIRVKWKNRNRTGNGQRERRRAGTTAHRVQPMPRQST